VKLVFKHIVIKILWISSWLIILSAVLLSMARLLTPMLDKHRDQFAYLAGKALEHPVTIGKLSASWYHFEPVFKFEEVVALNIADDQPILRVNELVVGINLFKSLWHWQLEPDILILNGSKLTIEQTDSGQFIVNGAKTTNVSTQSSANLGSVLNWLFSHGQLVLKDIDLNVHIQDKLSGEIAIHTINLTNEGKKHYLRGVVFLQQEQRTPVHFAADLTTGKALSQVENARFYLSVRRLSLDKFALGIKDQGWKISKGIMAAQVWGNWSKDGWQRLQSQVTFKDLFVNLQQSNFAHINRLAANLWAEKQQDGGWEFTADKLGLTLDDHIWPENKFQIITTKQADKVSLKQIQIGYLNLSDLYRFSKLLPEQWRTKVQALQPKGEISPFFWQQTAHGMTVASQFQNLSFKHWQQIPGVTNLTGRIKLLPTSGVLELMGKQSQLSFVKLFPHPLTLEQFIAKFNMQKQTDGWRITSREIQAQNQDIALQAAMTLFLPQDNSSPHIQLLAAIKANNVNHVNKYYPIGVMHKHLIDWLNSAIVQAKVITGTIVWRGTLHDFPYKKPLGVFSIHGQVKDAILAYHEGWPEIKQLAADLNFTGQAMQVIVEKGNILGSQIQNVEASIADMTVHPTAVLHVKGKVIGDATEAMTFIQQSPLQTSLGKSLQPLKLQGPLQTEISLTIPLTNQAADSEVKILGQSRLENATLTLPEWKLEFDKLNGHLSYSEKGLLSGELTGLAMGSPMQVAITHRPIGAKGLETQIKMRSQMTAKTLSQYFGVASLEMLSGQTAYMALFKIIKIAQQPLRQLLQIKSNLQGLTLPFPPPFTKTTEQKKPLAINLNINESQPNQLSWNYNEQLTGQITLQKNSQQELLMDGIIAIQAKVAKLMNKPGLYIIGRLAQFDWAVWQPWLEPLLKSTTEQKSSSRNLHSIRLYIGKISAFDQVIPHASIRLDAHERYWGLAIESEKVEGNIILPQNMPKKSILVDLDKLYLQKNSFTDASHHITAKDIPAINFNCQHFQYGEKQLGSLQLNTEPDKEGVNITKLIVNNPAFTLNLAGDWQQLGSEDYSHAEGKLVINNLAQALKILDMTPALSSSSGQASLSLDWLGKPYDFKLANLQGDIDLSLGRGQLANINSDAAAKIGVANLVNILSIESLARKLTLDFGDLTSKGFNFNKMRGSFKLHKGNAYTSNAYFDGNVAYIGFKGRIGLLKKDYNLSLKVVPYVTASLPILATIAGGPIVGAVSLVADKLLKHEIDHSSPYNYSLTGSWKKPHIEKLTS
jgi:uncharacterized protein (TIGR02099 family)